MTLTRILHVNLNVLRTTASISRRNGIRLAEVPLVWGTPYFDGHGQCDDGNDKIKILLYCSACNQGDSIGSFQILLSLSLVLRTQSSSKPITTSLFHLSFMSGNLILAEREPRFLAALVYQPEKVLEFEFKELLDFLHRYQNTSTKVRMVCPFMGVPLPIIDIKLDSSIQLSAKIELSLRLSRALLGHIFASRNVAEVAH